MAWIIPPKNSEITPEDVIGSPLILDKNFSRYSVAKVDEHISTANPICASGYHSIDWRWENEIEQRIKPPEIQIWNPLNDLKEEMHAIAIRDDYLNKDHCPYCHGHTVDDAVGNCAACGGPRDKEMARPYVTMSCSTDG